MQYVHMVMVNPLPEEFDCA